MTSPQPSLRKIYLRATAEVGDLKVDVGSTRQIDLSTEESVIKAEILFRPIGGMEEMSNPILDMVLVSVELVGSIPVEETCEAWLDFETRRNAVEPPEPLLSLHFKLEDSIDKIKNVARVTAPWNGVVFYSFRLSYSTDRIRWWPYYVPAPSMFSLVGEHVRHYKVDDYMDILNAHLKEQVVPLRGFDRLHSTKRLLHRQAWVEIATAAEIAIKDFLGRTDGSGVVSALLERVPSPPVHEMYGRVLEAVIGERSPVVSELQKGAEVRNLLVHRTNSISLNSRAVAHYRSFVETALYHLMHKLYPLNKEIEAEFRNRADSWDAYRKTKGSAQKGKSNYHAQWLTDVKAWLGR